MPAEDRIHDNVKNALVKAGWAILADPFVLSLGREKLYADLAAERPLAAEREGQKLSLRSRVSSVSRPCEI